MLLVVDSTLLVSRRRTFSLSLFPKFRIIAAARRSLVCPLRLLQVSQANRWMDMQNGAGGPEFKPAVTFAGTATEGRPGPQLGSVDIGVSHEAYLFRVTLPGLSKNQGDLKCRIQLDGSVQIRGIRMPCSDFLSSFPGEFRLRVQDLSPSGPFRICFKLPGPVEPRLFVPSYRDGILEGVVMKCRMPSAAPPAPEQTA